MSRPPKTQRFEKIGSSDAKLYGGIAAIVAALVGLVWWSVATEPTRASAEDGGVADETAEATGDGGVPPIERPPEASAKFAVVTEKADEVVKTLATTAEVAKRLDVRHCGGTCDAVRNFMTAAEGPTGSFEIEVVKTDDLILPPKDTMDTVAPGMTPRERDQARERKTSVVVRTHGVFSTEQMPARAAFAAAAVLAEALDGFVYDDVSRRMETTHEFVSHAVVAPLGQPVFARRHIVVQMYREDEGTARVLTLGMARFGTPDLSLRGAQMSSAPLLAEVLNTAASKLAHGATDATFTVTLEDVARVVGKKPAELNSNAARALPVRLTLVETEPLAGDPENEVLELRPAESAAGSTPESWDAVVRSLFGTPPSVSISEDDKELAEVAKNARKDLPNAIKRFQAGEGELFVKGPFPIPYDSRLDGGAATELLWIAAAACDDCRCTGVLSNEPSYATNLAAGKITSVERTQTVDWMIQHRDGGVAGGESIKVLKARAK